jgi:hypothetical protein
VPSELAINPQLSERQSPTYSFDSFVPGSAQR